MQYLTQPIGLGMFLLVGLIAGYIAEKVTASDHGLLTNLVVGVIGSYVGGFLAGILQLEFYGLLGHLVVATAGAILCIMVWRRLRS